ncbi:MAG: UDP-2,4-diacetamido-2,4,6-trideoxy-beta-L-altropyranose hydrolase [Rhodospirillaceae bacterium]|nr:UDP-2,4-diacetamido-2,4,6-trideoxy-beta-L-altropyranose hydrolase [Rhodospirillaceae bacterium]|tara:strand:- start:2120 stop:3139 length:1020 start_codon:yes stop_codon:yes gene_type:complete
MVIRVDADENIGMGHYMRCLALANSWCRRGGSAVILTNCAYEQKLYPSGIEVVSVSGKYRNSRQLLDLAKNKNADWIVVDGYHFSVEFIEELSGYGCRVLLIDDGADLEHYRVDVVLNQNIYASPSMYAGKAKAKLLLGPNYALIRPRFWAEKRWKRDFSSKASRLLVIFGGSDPQDYSTKFIEGYDWFSAKGALSELDIRLIVGPLNLNGSSIERSAANMERCQVLKGVMDIAEHTQWCDVALSSAGSTVWELSFYETPMILIPASLLEKKIAQNMSDSRAALMLENLDTDNYVEIFSILETLMYDDELRLHMGQTAGKLVDGAGAERVVDELRQFDN